MKQHILLERHIVTQNLEKHKYLRIVLLFKKTGTGAIIPQERS